MFTSAGLMGAASARRSSDEDGSDGLMECVCNLGKLKSFELVSHNVIKREMPSADMAQLESLWQGSQT